MICIEQFKWNFTAKFAEMQADYFGKCVYIPELSLNGLLITLLASKFALSFTCNELVFYFSFVVFDEVSLRVLYDWFSWLMSAFIDDFDIILSNEHVFIFHTFMHFVCKPEQEVVSV